MLRLRNKHSFMKKAARLATGFVFLLALAITLFNTGAQPHVAAVANPPVITEPVNGVVVDGQPLFFGTADPAEDVTLIDENSNVICSTTTDPITGAWACAANPPMAEGSHTATATSSPDGGVTNSAPSNTVNFTIDRTAPDPPVIITPANGSTTTNTTPPITGTAEPNATITVVIDDLLAGTTSSDGSGNWTFTPATPLEYGPHKVTAIATDAADHDSDSTEADFTVAAESDENDPGLVIPDAPNTGFFDFV